MAYIKSLFAYITLASFVAFGCSQSCDPSIQRPLSIPIRNVSLEAPVVRRGAAVSIGTPPQTFAFAIDVQANNTVVYDQSGGCGASTQPIQCLAQNGGAFDETTSSTWQDASNLPVPGDATTNKYGYDTITFNSSVNLSSFPIDIPRSHSFDMNVIGFGTRSTILDGLRNAGIIASRTFSMFFGLTGAEKGHQMDGNLVLGGYDAAKLTGQNYTSHLASDPGCGTGLLTFVSDMQLNFPNGTSQSIIGQASGSALKMCIEPNYELITLPLENWQLFQQYALGTYIGRSVGMNVWGEVYAADNVYAGDLTFIFSNNLEIKIPNHQLVVPDLSIDITGTTVFNSSTREVMLNSLQDVNKNDMPILGMTFLTSAYLSVNYDLGTFSLWQANPTADEKLVGIGQKSNGCLDASNPNLSATSSTPTASSSGSSSPSVKTSTNPMSNGAIAAIVIGASVLIAIIAGCLYMRRKTRKDRKWRSAAMSRDFPMEPAAAVLHEPVKGKVWYQKPELPGDTYVDNYADRDTRSVPGTLLSHELHENNYRYATSTPQELDGSR